MIVTFVFGALYGLAALRSYRMGRKPQARVATFIPEDRYYLWESRFVIPVSLLWIVLFGAFARQAAKRVGGTGSWRGDFTMLAFTQCPPMVTLFWVPDMACYLLRVDESTYRRVVPVYGIPAVLWAFALSGAGIAATEQLRWPNAFAVVAKAEIASALASGTAFLMR